MNHNSVVLNSQFLPLLDERIDYLTVAGEYFIYQKKFTEAIRIAEYILNDLDENSFKAKKIIAITKLKRFYYECVVAYNNTAFKGKHE